MLTLPFFYKLNFAFWHDEDIVRMGIAGSNQWSALSSWEFGRSVFQTATNSVPLHDALNLNIALLKNAAMKIRSNNACARLCLSIA